jgi:hypothetical protein
MIRQRVLFVPAIKWGAVLILLRCKLINENQDESGRY